MTTMASELDDDETTITAGARFPGLVDMHCHLRLPPRPDEQSERGLAAEAHVGGFRVVVVHITPAIVDRISMTSAQQALQHHGIEGVTLLAAVDGIAGDELADIASAFGAAPPSMPRVVRLPPHKDTVLVRRVLETARACDALVIAEPLDVTMAEGAVAFEGPIATRLGLAAMPDAAESIAVATLTELVRVTGARVHFAGIATGRGLALVETALSEGLDVSASVHATHLLLDDTALLAHRYDTRLRLHPPLPRASDRSMLVEAVRRGIVTISTGHRWVPQRERDLEIDKATPGARMLMATLPALRTVFDDSVLQEALSLRPAALLGIVPPAPVTFSDVPVSFAATEALFGLRGRGRLIQRIDDE
jgi:dihydroorotase